MGRSCTRGQILVELLIVMLILTVLILKSFDLARGARSLFRGGQLSVEVR